MNRAWSVFEIKSFDDDARTFEGIATTPTTDRMDDIVEPLGGRYTLPVTLKWQHGRGDIKDPVGWVTHASPTKHGITVKAKFAKVSEPPSLKEELDKAWGRVKAGLMRGLSIGFNKIKSEAIKDSFGRRYTEWDWLELSVVDIAANADATITSVKSADALLLAATGQRHSAVVRLGTTVNLPAVVGLAGRKSMKPIAEQIKELEAHVMTNEAQLDAIIEKSEGRSLDESENEDIATRKSENKAALDKIEFLKSREKDLIARAARVTMADGLDPDKASKSRDVVHHAIQVKSMLPKGTLMSRWVMAHVNFKGDIFRAADQAKTLWPDTPEMETILRAAVAAGTTTGTTWASPLVPAAQTMQNEFLELLRPATILGRIPGLRRVPVNISIPSQTGGGTFGWVGEGQAKPVSAMAFTAVTLRWAKAAGIVVLTKELIRFSSPNAEAVVRESMIKDTAQFLDAQFVGAAAAVANISPAGIRNGATTAAATGVTAATFLTDFKTALATFIAANTDISKLVILLSSTVALNISTLKDGLGNVIYPNLTMAGGNILGIPVVVSEAVGNNIIFLNAGDILLADDGPIEIDASDQASIVMDDAPQASPQTTSLVSLYQRNLVALRVEQYITWLKARATSVYYISSAAYTG